MIFFHQNIKTLRKKSGLTQLELSELIGISQAAYQKWEQDRTPSLEKIVFIARFYKITIDDLLCKDLRTNNKIGSALSITQETEHLSQEDMEIIRSLQATLKELKEEVEELKRQVKQQNENIENMKKRK